MRGSVCWVGLEVRRDDMGDLEEEPEVAGVKLGRGIESECCAAERNPLLWLSPCQEDF